MDINDCIASGTSRGNFGMELDVYEISFLQVEMCSFRDALIQPLDAYLDPAADNPCISYSIGMTFEIL